MAARDAEHGFTIIELLVATAILVTASLLAFEGVRAALNELAQQTGGQAGAAALDGVAAQLQADAASAVAIGVPGADCVNGSAGGFTGVTFLTQDASGAGHVIAYAAAGTTVTRTLDTAAGATYAGVGRFDAACLTAAQAAAANPALAGVTVKNRLMSVGASLGGNDVVAVTLGSGTYARTLHLVAAVPPSGFSVVGGAQWHAVLYRIDQTHRSWLGLVQQSHIWVKSRLYVDVPGQAPEQMVCEWDPWGQQAPHDPHNDYDPNRFSEERLPNIWQHAIAACSGALVAAFHTGGIVGPTPGPNFDRCEDTSGNPVPCATPPAVPKGTVPTAGCIFTYGLTGCQAHCHAQRVDPATQSAARTVRAAPPDVCPDGTCSGGRGSITVCDGNTTGPPSPDPSASPAAAPTVPPTPTPGERACAYAAENLTPPVTIAGEDATLPATAAPYPAYRAPGAANWSPVASAGTDAGGVNATLLAYTDQFLLVAEATVGGTTQVECVPLV